MLFRSWTVEDPERLVSSMMADLLLLVVGEPTLVDFGGGSMVYTALRKGQRAVMVAGPGPSWSIDIDGAPYADGMQSSAEGWAHLMDLQRATAVAVAGFAETRRDSIQVSADGRLMVRRDFPGGGERSLKFWLHFVGMPVQVGAATSPQSMRAPLRVEWE